MKTGDRGVQFVPRLRRTKVKPALSACGPGGGNE